MKIAILSEAGAWGGAEVHAAGLAGALVELGHEAAIVCLDSATHALYRSVLNDAIPLVNLDARKPVAARNLLDWLLAFRGVTADACVYAKGALFAGSLALELAARIHFPRFATIEHLQPPALPPKTSKAYLGGLLPGIGLWWYRWVVSGYLRSIGPHQIIAVSDAVRRQLIDDYRFPSRKVFTVYNGIDPHRFHPDPAGRLQFRQRWGLSASAFAFGAVCRVVNEKGLDLAVEAFAALAHKFPRRDLALVLVGDGPERPALQRLAAERGVGRQVIFTGGMLSPCHAYAAFDCYLVPSRAEALGIALLEAMASGCCSIAAKVGGLPEVLSGPSLGLLVPPENAEALAQAMEQVLAMSPEQSAAMQSHARQHIVEHFSARAQFAKIARLIADRPGQAPGTVTPLNSLTTATAAPPGRHNQQTAAIFVSKGTLRC